MGAIQDAIALYGPDFPRLHGMYLERGFCYSEPTMLALARPCLVERYEEWVEPQDADAWWIELCVGPNALSIMYSKIPFPFAKIGWRRDFKNKPIPRFYDFYKLQHRLNHGF